MPIDQARLNREYVFAGKGTPAQLLSELPKIQAVLQSIRRKVRALRWSAAVVGVVGVVSGFVFFKPLIFLGIVGLIALLVWAGKSNAVLKNADHCGALEDILQKLSYDSGPKARFVVTMRLKDERKLLSSHPYKTGKQSIYLNPWLDVQGQFLDGTVLTENITDVLRERTKKNPRGKIKSKSRRRHVISMRLQYPAARYGNAAPVALKLKTTFHLPKGAVVKALKPTAQSMVVKAVAEEGVDLKHVQDALLLGLYRILNLAHVETARKSRA